jgi:t-SNARE complex subunit (syntaxin)
MTNAMTVDATKQGEALSKFLFNPLIESIEDNVIEVNHNAVKAEKEINAAEKKTRSTSRKLYWMFFLLLIVIIAIIIIIILILVPDDKKV